MRRDRQILLGRIQRLKLDLSAVVPVLQDQTRALTEIAGPLPLGERTVKLVFERIYQVLDEAADHVTREERTGH